MFRIKELRINARLTQEELADMVGISRIYLSELENGRKTNPSTKLLKKLTKVLGVSMAELYKGPKSTKTKILKNLPIP